MYTSKNFKTKKALREALANGEKLTVYEPGPFGSGVTEGKISLEGPHYPAPHTWYAEGVLEKGYLVSVK